MRPLTLVILLSIAGMPQSPATGNADQHSLQVTSLPIAIDGALAPDNISDTLAYRHFIMAVAVARNPSIDEIDRRDALLHQVGFSPADYDAFVSCLAGVREALDANALKLVASTGPTSEALELRSQNEQLLDSAQASIMKALSPSGKSLLEAFIRTHVKPRIIVYGEPSQ
jgi:hypothetical protein